MWLWYYDVIGVASRFYQWFVIVLNRLGCSIGKHIVYCIVGTVSVSHEVISSRECGPVFRPPRSQLPHGHSLFRFVVSRIERLESPKTILG
jgi:hypothetical protein